MIKPLNHPALRRQRPEVIEDFEVVYRDGDGTMGSVFASAGLLAHTCSEILSAGCKIVGVCRLGQTS